ncbi:MAG: YceI family protein [Corticimicrobacter sp.]|uniref:Polyisoprenoid-binding protein n=1 Tax=Corticimicrobacter populi TaxID=2175229 RepID=A0A2V1JV68_9BURK|nr:YceI family protein [Corticimicrobacter populi]PWF22088.1 polyisoprenoid-binding protein [Corticimicrobacter populi]
MQKTFARLTLAAALATGLSAAALAAPTTYEVEGSHTAARFSYDHLGLSTQIHRFDTTTGTIVLDPAAKTGTVDITIDTTTVDTGHEAFNGHIQGADFLDTATYPTATFKSTKVNFDGDTPVSVDGDLTIKGVTKPITLKLDSFTAKEHPMMKKPVIGANATAVIKRSDFNAGKFAPAVGDEVTLNIALEAVQK